MSSVTTTPPARRSELLLQPLGGGRCVVKDRESGDFFEIGEEEHFLLERLDGKHNGDELRQAFEERFDEPLSDEDLDEFIDAGERGT
mgnify:FL=1